MSSSGTNSHITDILELGSDRWRLALQPSMGLQTVRCQVELNGSWLDVMPDCTNGSVDLQSSNFHMLPYSNRIRDGHFVFKGKAIDLDNAGAHAIHGALRKKAWRISQQSASSVTAEYNSNTDGAVNWPWAIGASVHYSLSGNCLNSTMRLTNLGNDTMPAGMGWHPYFCRQVSGAHPVLTIPVTGYYPDTNGDCLPTGPALPLTNDLNFINARALDANQRIDHCLSGLHGKPVLSWPDAGVNIEMSASGNCTHLVLFNPDKPYFAVEPVTNANDAFNLTANGIDAGVVELAAGESLEASMSLELV